MPIITLPDGNSLNFSNDVTGLGVAEKISKSLAKQAMVISVNGELKDCLLYTSPSPRDRTRSRMPSSA